MLNELLTRARGRFFRNRLLFRLPWAGSFFFAALAVLVVLGTQIFDWWIPLALGFLAVGLEAFWTARRIPSLSAMALILDRRCDLADLLSTAFHFRDSTSGLAVAQRHQAESAIRKIDVQTALPLRRSRSIFVLAACAGLALFLLIFRYGTERELRLALPILLIRQDVFAMTASGDDKPKPPEKSKTKPNSSEFVSKLGSSTTDNPNARELEGLPGSAFASGEQEGKEATKTAGGERSASKDGQSAEGESNPGEPGAGASKAGEDQPPSARDGAPQAAQQPGGKTPGASEGSGMLSRLKDAVSSLISKMTPQPNSQTPQNGQQQTQQASGKPPAGQQSGQKQSPKGSQGAESSQESDDSASAESEQMAPGKGAGKGSDQNASAKPGSGMGRQDGNKDLKDAEQLAAMGKLSEIIGKRSASVTGEMTIESQSGPQQLKTGYSHSSARHGESGGDVSRDEVSVPMQSYVQQYFEQVRKQAASKAARVGKAEPQE